MTSDGEADLPESLPQIARILVPIDGSEQSRAALPYAEVLARQAGADVVLVQAVTSEYEMIRETASAYAVRTGYDVAAQRLEAETRQAETALETMRSALEARGVPARQAVVTGPPAKAITDMALQENASIICMATRGRGGVSRAVLGSVADEVVRHADVPVMLVRH